MNKGRRIIKTVLDPKTIAGILISAVGIYWAFKDFHFVEFANSITQVNYLYLLLATLFLWGSVWFRALRWRWLFNINNMPTTESLYRAEMIGYFGNNVLPLRLGELIRSYLIGKEWKISKSYVFGTVVLERILDAIVLVFLAGVLIMVYPLEGSIIKAIIWCMCLIFIATLIFWIIRRSLKTIMGNHKILNILRQMSDGVLSVDKSAFLPVTLLSILIWGIYFLDVFLLQYAFGFNLSFYQILTVLVFSAMVLAIPSAPGMIGTYHAAVKYTIVDLFGFAPHEGTSFAIFMHAYGYILFTLLGAYYYITNQFHKNVLETVMDKDLNN